MRILLATEPSGGGSGRHVIDLAEGLCRLGHDVSVIYSSARAEGHFLRELAELPLSAAINVPMKRSVAPSDVRSAWLMAQQLRTLEKFDVVHAHSSKAGALLRLIAPRGAARVYTPHAFRTMDPTISAKSALVYGSIERILAALITDAVIAVAPEEAEHARLLGVADEKLYTVVNGVTPPPQVDRNAVRAELDATAADIIVGFVGRLCEQKDPLRFAHAMRIARGVNPSIKGVILGDGELKSAVLDVGGEAIQVLSGRNARAYMPAFDVFAMTSQYEAMPYVLLEALQAGLPIVTTRVGGTTVALDDNENGFILPVDVSAEDFAKAVIAASEDDKRQRMAAASLNRAKCLTAAEMARQTLDVYLAAISRRRRITNAR